MYLSWCRNCRERIPHLASDIRCEGCARNFYKGHESGYQVRGPYRGKRLCADCIVEIPGATVETTPYAPYDPYSEFREISNE